MHPMGAQLSQECVVMMGDAMCTPLFHNQFRVTDLPGLGRHRGGLGACLRLPQQATSAPAVGHAGDRWVLKTGAHMWGLEHLLATYPDARIVFTHRDPVKSLTSYASLTALVRSMGSDHVDKFEVADGLEPAPEARAGARDRGAHGEGVSGRDVLRHEVLRIYPDQFAVVEQIYDAFGLPMTEEAAARMKWFIADNPQGKHGIHRYSPEEYGIDPQVVRREFRPYIERFGLPPE